MSEPIDLDMIEKIYRDAMSGPEENPIVDWILDDNGVVVLLRQDGSVGGWTSQEGLRMILERTKESKSHE